MRPKATQGLIPDYTYAQDQAVVLEMMERYFPDIFKGIVQKAKNGRG